MALRGTLRDFGIADIFQLISHQSKTGSLTVRSGSQQVVVAFLGGNVVRAESATRKRRDLLGRMLVRGELITEKQLADALEMQKRTLRRLGDILVDSGVVDVKALRVFTRLQTTETLYRLFLWTGGTYEFEQTEVPVPDGIADHETIRSDNVLMEGFRQLDEWPMIRKRITGYGLTFEKVEDLDALVAAEPSGDDLGLDDAFGEMEGGGGKSGRLRNIGHNERLVFQLVTPERDVQKVIDLSRLGEFETCKALATLVEAEILRPAAEHEKRPSADATVGGISARAGLPLASLVLRVALFGALAAGLWQAAHTFRFDLPKLAALVRPVDVFSRTGYLDVSVQRVVSEARVRLVIRALDAYRAQFGAYPIHLDDLVAATLLRRRDLAFPWQHPYVYRRVGEGYKLHDPLY